MGEEETTRGRILASAKEHFLREGFERASLRRIAADAGFTTGALYGCFAGKEDLFAALVDDTARAVSQVVARMSAETAALPPAQTPAEMPSSFYRHLPRLVDALFVDPDGARLLLTAAAGTRYEGFLDAAAGRNRSTFARMSDEARLGISPRSIEILNDGYFAMLKQAFLAGGTKEEVLETMADVQLVFSRGMITLLQQAQQAQEVQVAQDAQDAHEAHEAQEAHGARGRAGRAGCVAGLRARGRGRVVGERGVRADGEGEDLQRRGAREGQPLAR